MRTQKYRNSYSSGYTMVDILGNEDLFPDQGYEFPPHPPKQSTRDRYVSVDFPLNTTINTTAVLHQKELQPPEPVIDKPLPKVKDHRRRLIYETTINVRKKQIEYNTLLKEYNREKREQEKEQEAYQLKIAREAVEKEEERHMGDKQKLRENYEEQIRAHQAEQEKKHQEELQEVEAMKRANEKERMKELLKEEKDKQIRQEIRDDFLKRNQMLQEMKETRHIRQKEEEKEIQRQAASMAEIEEARTKREEEVRLEKTKRRAIVVEMQAKALAQQKQKIDDFQEKAESQAAINAEKERTAMIEKRKKQEEDRKKEWQTLAKENDAKNKIKTKKAFPTRDEYFDEEKFNAEQTKREREYYKTMQMKQAADRRQREKEEQMMELEIERQNLERTDNQFNASIKKLQDSVPVELGITVPQYKPSMKITGMV